MSKSLSDSQIQSAIGHLGVQPQEFQRIGTLPTYEARCEALTVLKADLRKRFKRAALLLHPDRTGDDPEKTEQFKVLVTFMEQVEQLQVRPPAPPVQYYQFATSASSTSTVSFYRGTIRIVVG